MHATVQVTFRNMPPSPDLEAAIVKKIERLGRRFERVESCQVVVEAPSTAKRRIGRHFHVRVALRVPGRTLSVGKTSAASNADLNLALRDAIGAVRRCLDENARRRPEGGTPHPTTATVHDVPLRSVPVRHYED
jgi:ribosome-associated translation inhibitor RaiA